MKNLKFLLSLIMISFTALSFAQTDKATTIKIVTNRNYVFVANTAIPMNTNDMMMIMNRMPGGGGGTINLSGSQYDVRVTKDSIVAYLPYFGRAYNAPMPYPNEGGIKFTSKDFTYKESKNKKEMYTIQISTKDVKIENYQFTINISTNGYASLIASSNSKQPITFDGYLSEPKKSKTEEAKNKN